MSLLIRCFLRGTGRPFQTGPSKLTFKLLLRFSKLSCFRGFVVEWAMLGEFMMFTGVGRGLSDEVEFELDAKCEGPTMRLREGMSQSCSSY